MSESPSYPSRLKFSSDLRRIRETRGLTLEALHEETKIPLSVLQDFEETGLYGNPMFNRVYLRSLVRTYASFVEIPSKVALEGLDEALLDSYKGRLAVDFLGERPPEHAAPPAAEVPEKKVPQAAAPGAEPKPPEKPVAKPPPEPAKTEKPVKTKRTLLTTAEPFRASQSRGGRRVRPVDIKKRASHMQWLLIVGAVLAFTAAIWVVLALLDRPGGTRQQQAAVVDTTAVDTVAVEPTRLPIIIGDTLDFVVVALRKVERIHIKRDEDARRPYWIEEGVAKAYPAHDRIIIEDRLDRIQLLVEGYAYPTDGLDAQGRLVVTRAAVQAFVDTLTADPVQLPVAPDTIRLFPSR